MTRPTMRIRNLSFDTLISIEKEPHFHEILFLCNMVNLVG